MQNEKGKRKKRLSRCLEVSTTKGNYKRFAIVPPSRRRASLRYKFNPLRSVVIVNQANSPFVDGTARSGSSTAFLRIEIKYSSVPRSSLSLRCINNFARSFGQVVSKIARVHTIYFPLSLINQIYRVFPLKTITILTELNLLYI